MALGDEKVREASGVSGACTSQSMCATRFLIRELTPFERCLLGVERTAEGELAPAGAIQLTRIFLS